MKTKLLIILTSTFITFTANTIVIAQKSEAVTNANTPNKTIENKNISAVDSLPFTIRVEGKSFVNQQEDFEITSIDKFKAAIIYDFMNKAGDKYQLHIDYKNLASNRSFPTNLDITLKNHTGEKLGYLFFAINDISFLKTMGEFGMIVNANNELMDIKFIFDKPKVGNLVLKDLLDERYVQDTLLPSKNFQMIRPVLLKQTDEQTLSQSYALDAHPFEVNYTLKDIGNGTMQFQHNLSSTKSDQKVLLERIYYSAHNIETLRTAMFAGKYFDEEYGAFKLVFYPTKGQTSLN